MTDKEWNKLAADKFLGKRIIDVRYMKDEEAQASGFYRKALIIALEDGIVFYASSDDEGNDAGAIHALDHGKFFIFPVI